MIKIIYEALFILLLILILTMLVKININQIESQKDYREMQTNLAIIAEQLQIDTLIIK
jgi:hypothetical protein